MFNGVVIYIVGIVILFILNKVSFLGLLYILLYFLVNPLMIYVYDYLINPKRLAKRLDWYYIVVILCFLLDTLIWDRIRFIPNTHGQFFLASFLGIAFTVAFAIQVVIALQLRTKKVVQKYAVPILLILPLMTYGVLATITAIMLNMSV